jgi:hypothetical protein
MIAFCSVAFNSDSFGSAYLKQQERLKKSLIKIYGNEDLYFWTNRYPKNSKTHYDSTYGFKVHAIQHCLDLGYKKIIWLDTAMIVNNNLDFLFDKSPVVAVMDVTPLKNVTMNKVKDYYNIDCDGWFLCGGSMFSFDFNKEITHNVFNFWKDAEKKGFFGNQIDESAGLQNGHRWDETMMSIALYKNNLSPISRECIGYDDENIILKKHFK